jgi:hypothetical protein
MLMYYKVTSEWKNLLVTATQSSGKLTQQKKKSRRQLTSGRTDDILPKMCQERFGVTKMFLL